ncbi:hypothetical protein FB567DRAFT_561248 [Paraphoma chrysanthemicola]|uniref:Uncharacterized protein n=1 Tax=Paraphoma chrysanthemicola TaxID=798071 RepID=A0A8K0R475_9PLEO|nr:hypothetical protein FB567DRAFT_561248 [Paraphoma chrysanthemicola]
MRLEALPVEIISGICRVLGRRYFRDSGDEVTVFYDDRDFQALRITCKELYHKTEFDATIRYSCLLEVLNIPLDLDGIIQLYQISKKIAWRDWIDKLFLSESNLHDDSGEDDEDDQHDPIYGHIASPARILHEELAMSCRASSEELQLLAECFRNLKSAKNLSRIQLNINSGHEMFLHAMVLANFPHKVATFLIHPKDFSTVGYGSFLRSPQNYLSVVKGLQIQPSFYGHDTIRLRTSRQKAENNKGLHLQNYRPTTKSLTQFISTLNTIESLELHGCRSRPCLRLCHGCDDLFVQNFARTVYSNLTHLIVTNMFISGSRLRAFIKRHTETLHTVYMYSVTLTDGTWRSIMQGLAKLNVRCLVLTSLWQKRPAQSVTQGVVYPTGYTPQIRIYIEGAAYIKEFLHFSVLLFKTVSNINSARFTKPPPKYHEVRLFQPPTAESSRVHSKSTVAIRQYAGVGA